MLRNRDELIEAMAAGESVEFLFFWGHRPSPTGEITKSCLSQWFAAPFEFDGVCYETAEHFMMAKKAKLFGDESAEQAIVAAADPGKAKAIGRKVANFDEGVWIEHRSQIVVEANTLKFGRNPRLKKFLLGTGDAVLVEASPTDVVWGIGLAADAPAARDPSRWRGLNLLGFALMEVRTGLRKG